MHLAKQNKPDDTASDWFVRLHSGGVTSSVQRNHEDWLAEDNRNRMRYDAVEHSMRDLSGIDDWMRAEANRLNARVMSRRARRTKVMVAGFSSLAAALAAVTVGTMLTMANRYETAKAEQREISLDDGSRIHLNSASSVAIRYSTEMRTVELHNGEGVFDVSHDAQRPFVVSAAGAEVVAIGTRFRVRLADGEVTVTVLEGAVAVFNDGAAADPTSPERETTLLYPNDQVTLNDGGVTAVESVDALAATAWREGKLIFDATPLRQVVEEMAQYTQVGLDVADDVPDYPITGLIQIRSPDAMLRFVANAVPITPVRAAPERIVLHATPPAPL
ncbi:MAG: FecR domain-containing protein [Gammaproteobacteria bacterium]|nr:FecR domain-containing protein [Gammaproteobacteria bacterium]